jgi:hypothetical protein
MAIEVVKCIYSTDGRHRAEIVRRPSGGFQVDVFRWNEEWVEGYGKVAEFWEQANRGVTLTDTLEHAEELAVEKLVNY